MTDNFRKIYGDELADQVEQLKAKRAGSVWRSRKPRPELDVDGKPLPDQSNARARSTEPE